MSVSLRERIRRGDLTIGSWLNLGNIAVAEIMADAGFDWLAVDLEHTTTSLREAEDMMRIIDLKGVAPLVRLSANDPVQIKRMLDAGAQGVIVPMVKGKADAEAAVTAVKYPPAGTRGVGIARAQGYGPKFNEYTATANEHTIVVAQIEHYGAVEALTAIQSVPGVDATMIGPYDLSGSVGKLGHLDDPEVVALVERYRSISAANSHPAGIHIVEPDRDRAERMIRSGYRFIAFGVDFLFLGASCRRELTALKSNVAQQ